MRTPAVSHEPIERTNFTTMSELYQNTHQGGDTATSHDKPGWPSGRPMIEPAGPLGSLSCDAMVSWPARWALVDGVLYLKTCVSPKIPVSEMRTTINLDELENSHFRARLSALLAS